MATAKKRPGTGDPRRTQQPLKIDRLPPPVHEAILALRNQANKTWQEIEDLSAVPVDQPGGFVDWMNLPTAVLELFPDMRIPHSNLQRWYDLRVTQVTRDTMRRSAQAREIAEAFARSVVANGDEAVLNAARDTFMAVLAEDVTPRGRSQAGKALIALAEVMQGARANDIKERKVATDERKLKLLEEREKLAIRKLEAETDRLAKKAERGEAITPEDLAEVRKQTFGF